MQPLHHLDHLRSLRDDPRAVPYFIDRAHRLRAEAHADAWRWFVGVMRRGLRVDGPRRPMNANVAPREVGSRPTG